MKWWILFAFLVLTTVAAAQVQPQISGAGAPANPCVNGGQQYLDTTNHVLYNCPANGSNWALIGLGNVASNTATTTGSGTPSGNCTSSNVYYINTANGDFWDCPTPGSTWVKAGNTAAGGGNVSTTQSNTYGAFLQDFSAATIKVPQAAGFTTTVNSTEGLDTTANIFHFWQNSADSLNVVTTSTTTTTTQPVFATAVAGIYNPRAIATGDLPAAVVLNNAANTGAAAMTLNMSASTGADSLRVPVQPGCTAGGADGDICYDSTNLNTHIRSNTADALAVAETAAIVVNTIPKAATSTRSVLQGSSILDNGTTVKSTEQAVFGTAGTSTGYADLTIGTVTSNMAAQSSSTCTNITNMTWTIAANKNYTMHCFIPVTFAASATIQFCIGGPGTPTSHSINAVGSLGAAGVYGDIELNNSATYGTKTTASGAVNGTQIVMLDAVVRNGATASGTALTLQTAANGTNNITVLADAACSLTQAN